MRPRNFPISLTLVALTTFVAGASVLEAGFSPANAFAAAKESQSPAASEDTKPIASFSPQLRWGRVGNDSYAGEIVASLGKLFETNSERINFAKNELPNLLEQALPRSVGRLFPFRRSHKIPESFFFENFGREGFFVGELDPKVPPILSATDTADWVELRSPRRVETAREFTPPLPLSLGLRGLGTQKPWSTEIFSSSWNLHFDNAAAIVEFGGLKCWNKAQPKKPFASLAEPSQFTKCSTPLKNVTQDVVLPKQLPRKIGAAAAAASAAVNPPSAPPNCFPMGSLQTQTLELLGDEKAGHCLLWRASQDERFLHKPLSSKLICLNARHKSFQKTRFSSVVAILPSSWTDSVHVIESDDGLVTSHRLSLATLSVTKEEILVPTGQNLRSSAFPRQRTGLYACQQNSTAAAPSNINSDVSPSSVDWIYVDSTVYEGLRPTRPETDVAWRLRDSKNGAVEVERLSWPQLQYDHPSITNERPYACVAARHIDARCGLRVLQTAMQLSEEWLNRDFDKSDVPAATQLAAVLIVAQSLEKLVTALPDWSLRGETEALLDVYSLKAKQLLENKSLASSGIKAERMERTTRSPKRYVDLTTSSPDYIAIKNLLSTSADFWALLKQKSL
ncbi:MAG: hypothetical protein EBR09_07160 [Proteobacteria bacterium]|nr:hypothetical protein [Pseudomonadota bacterium]